MGSGHNVVNLANILKQCYYDYARSVGGGHVSLQGRAGAGLRAPSWQQLGRNNRQLGSQPFGKRFWRSASYSRVDYESEVTVRYECRRRR